eukprot:maker-scaffold_7-snap-gene-12.40-mRNA-1 protein AED:0.00 eAED:0.00 QI:142/1/1/1/1/1/2/190/533
MLTLNLFLLVTMYISGVECKAVETVKLDTSQPFLSRAHERMLTTMEEKARFWSNNLESIRQEYSISSSNQAQSCGADFEDSFVTIDGVDFSCKNIDFESYISLEDLNIDGRTQTNDGSDIWGWLDSEGREIVIMCVDNGVWFVDGTDPVNPVRLGYMESARPKSSWCDAKVYLDTVYVVKDSGNSDRSNGIEVFDLTRLNNLTGSEIVSFEPDFIYTGHGASHNLVVDTQNGFLYSVGTDSRTDSCAGGLHILDLSEPLEPAFVTCVASDGYTHDALALTYEGADERFVGKEIVFAANEDTLTIWDASDKTNVTLLSRVSYSTYAYTHQVWITLDQNFILLNDELDEIENKVNSATSYIVDVSSLTDPTFVNTFTTCESSIDHNLYVWADVHSRGAGGNPPLETIPSANFAYLSNYASGLRVLDISDPTDLITEVGYFDVSPLNSGVVFLGTWSHYMFPSGTVAVSSIELGLFFLTPRMAFDDSFSTISEGTASCSLEDSSSESYAWLSVLLVLPVGVLIFFIWKNKNQKEML